MRKAIAFACALLACAATPAAAAQLRGRVISSADSTAVPYAVVQVLGTGIGGMAGDDGRFEFDSVPMGRHVLSVSRVGFAPARRIVHVGKDPVEVVIVLDVEPIVLPELTVRALRPDLRPNTRMQSEHIREANPRDAAELLRELPGLDAVRRGPIGLDPVVRGLRETEVGVYLDGTRIFPAGPARMDSPLSHFDPAVLGEIDVVTGPYALTWGAGNMSAIRARLRPLLPRGSSGLHGSIGGGYDSNVRGIESLGSLNGRRGRLAWNLSGAWRDGDDYEAGDGSTVPGDYRSWEARGRVRIDSGERSGVTLSAAYQRQDDIDYPGRLLDARLFRTLHLRSEWSYDAGSRAEGLQRASFMVYYNRTLHTMDNDNKPTAQPDTTRMPPFPLDVTIHSDAIVAGGRARLRFRHGVQHVTVGVDAYAANRDAHRSIRRRDNGMPMFDDIVWPDAWITDVGAFAELERPVGATSVSGAVRLDFVAARADSVSDFFRRNTSGDLDANEWNASAMISASRPLGRAWSMSASLGTVVRTADATERYSDRIPSSRAQTSAEFMGNPALRPERATQIDMWVTGRLARARGTLRAFARRIDDYITLEATQLPHRLPLSPPTVFRYVNGSADFGGVDGEIDVSIAPPLTVSMSGAWLWGQDRTLDEPALGIAPWRVTLSARVAPPGRPGEYVEVRVRHDGRQDRVALTRGESPTPAHTIADIRAGVRLFDRVQVRGGVLNLTDEFYADHLNARNPFTGDPVPEPGRMVFVESTVGF